jgi:uncharacterized protein YndB with AHSA1/START domain
MPGFEERAVCRAPAEEVWKLLYDPARFSEWWAGWERVEAGEGGAVTRYDGRWPDFAYPANVTTRREEGRVVVSCQLSDIVHEWILEPAPGGCALLVRVDLPAEEAGRLEDQRSDVRESLARLVARAEAP